MPLSTLIGIFGPAQSGKNAIVDIMVRKYSVVPLSVSKGIKDEAHRIVGKVFSEDEKDTSLAFLYGHTPRELYVQLGNIDDFVPGHWVSKTIEYIKVNAGHVYVIESIGKQHQWNEILNKLPSINLHLLEVRRLGYNWGDKDTRGPVCDSRQGTIIENYEGLESLENSVDTYMNYSVLNEIKSRPAAEIWEFLGRYE